MSVAVAFLSLPQKFPIGSQTFLLLCTHTLVAIGCSGLPTPDKKHAQNIANFSLAVQECVKLVQSPADGTHIQLRIGIHTGHCMGGVVGTLTPHYCLFGDMVNTTARHESTSLSGKIQCSNTLYDHLIEHSGTDGRPQYKFTPRGYVEMKGKGRRFTYWLESGTHHNKYASPKRIQQLCSEVGDVLSKKKWKKRQYFNYARRKSMGGYDDTTFAYDADDGMISTEMKFPIDASEVDSRASLSDEILSSTFETASYSEMKNSNWIDIKWDPQLSRIDSVAAIHGILSSMLWMCTAEIQTKSMEDKNLLDSELLRYVEVSHFHGMYLLPFFYCLLISHTTQFKRISSLYPNNPFHNFEHACQVTLSTAFLAKEYHRFGPVDKNPFVRFIAVVRK